ncbi:hypothetical protein V6O07_10015, partial [Arthrospira platensis SPKY2]
MSGECLFQQCTRLCEVAVLLPDHAEIAQGRACPAQISDGTADCKGSLVEVLGAPPVPLLIVENTERTQRIGLNLCPSDRTRQRKRPFKPG